jgi:hypothetical protein
MSANTDHTERSDNVRMTKRQLFKIFEALPDDAEIFIEHGDYMGQIDYADCNVNSTAGFAPFGTIVAFAEPQEAAAPASDQDKP